MKRLLWVCLSALLFFVALSNFLLCEFRLRDTFEKTRKQLIAIASNAAQAITSDEVFNVPLERASEWTPGYQVIYNKLLKVKVENPSLKYVYVMTTTNQPGILQYVVDANPVPEIITAHCPTSLPGDKYDARNLPEMLAAYNKPSADKKISGDSWGVFISGYAPIRDASGNSVAILGIDTDASSIQIMRKNARTAGGMALFTFILLISSLAVLLIKPLTEKEAPDVEK